MTPPDLDRSALKVACLEVAKGTLWQTPKPETIDDIIDTDQIHTAVHGYLERALTMAEIVRDAGGDPDVVTRAVRYLAHVHAIPPMKEDIVWFRNALDVLIELLHPNVEDTVKHHDKFLRELRNAIDKQLPKPRRKAPNQAL